MADALVVPRAHRPGERSAGDLEAVPDQLTVDSFAGKISVQWAPQEAVTPLGQLPFFIDFLKQSGLFEQLVREAPLSYSSPNAPRPRDVLGTLVLSMVAGGLRYAHVNALRYDGVNPELLGMKRVCSDDSVRRAVARLDAEEAEQWLCRQLEYVWRPLLQQDWILDVDTTVKPLYGRQEGAQVGYSPHKRGRPAQVIHVYEMGTTRLVLEAEVVAGKQHHSQYGLPGLERSLDRLAEAERPALVRGDCGYGTERVMEALEQRGQDYLFKLPMRPRVKELVQRLAGQGGWEADGQGWEMAEAELQLLGWTRARRVLVVRRKLGRKRPRKALARQQPLLPFAEVIVQERQRYEYGVLVTSRHEEGQALAQLYRERGDAENALDELKNQWGWGGFVTQDLQRTAIMARLNALVYNWWSLYVRMIDPEARREAQTSRPQMMDGVARVTQHGRQKRLIPTIAHSAAGGLRAAFVAMTRFLREVQNAPQLTPIERWCRILGYALRKYFRGKVPDPPPGLLPA